MKARDLIKMLETNPEADVLIEGATHFSPVEAGAYPWGTHLFVIVQEEYLAKAEHDATHDPDRDPFEHYDVVAEAVRVARMKATGYVDFIERDEC